MGARGGALTRSSLTEETPATPGWVNARIKQVFAPFGDRAVAVGEAYASCLAGVRGAVDIDSGHDRCRQAALAAIEDPAHRDALDHALQALEAEVSDDT